jgi:crotonobetainyl-CoA:carnitine CoA-transferase CaiB-like acyl-CoA transferase
MSLPLSGYRVLDLSRRAPGQFCTWILADMGADVLRIEEPTPRVRADVAASELDTPAEARALACDSLNRNKRSIALNLKAAAAQAVLHKLCAGADVLIESFRPGVAVRLGADYSTVSAINPRIVYCSLSGFGQGGPYSGLPGHDLSYQALAGALGLSGPAAAPPTTPPSLLGDFAAGGMHAALGIVMALLARQHDGRGQQIDCAMTDGIVALLGADYSDYFAGGQVPAPGGGMFTGGSPAYQSYRTQDGRYISIACNDAPFFARLCGLLELEEFLPHRRDAARYPEMQARFAERFATRTQAEWWQLFQVHDICGAPVYTLAQACEDPHLQARRNFISILHPELGAVRQVAPLLRLSAAAAEFRTFAPRVGEHTCEILHSLGYSEIEIAALRQAQAIG